MRNVADVLAFCLAEAGLDTVFGLPGGENVEVLDALRRRGFRFVLVHRESSAVFMASATARLTGRPAACLATLGPGAANAITGVAHALLDRAPVIVITAQTPEHLLSRHTHQVVQLEALFSPVTKASFALTSMDTAEMVRHAIALAITGRPGPVHLRISSDQAGGPATSEQVAVPQVRLSPMEQHVETARALLCRSRRPVILAGLGLEPERPYRALIRLAGSIHAPVMVTPKAKGAIPDDHPLSAGTIGLTKTDPVYEVVEEADWILGAGFDVVEIVKPWDHPAPFTWVAPWANRDPALPAAVELIGPMRPVLEALAEVEVKVSTGWGAARVARHHKKHPRLKPHPSPSGRITPQAAFRALRQILPRDAVFTTDVGSHKILACLEWPAYAPNRFLVSNGLSSMGYALPAALAASLVLADTPVVCTTGDAGLLMALGELNTLARLEAPVTVVVFKDNALDLIRSQQVRSGKPVFGTEFTAPDFVQLSRAFGIRARCVSEEDALGEAIQWALSLARPALIEVEIDPSTYPTTPRA